MAIHDAAYASPPPSWTALRWRLQHLSEERIGPASRRQDEAEGSAWEAALGAA